MKILLVGGSSSLGKALIPVLSSFAEVVTAGRSNCDLDLDLTWPMDQFQLPEDLDVVINLAAYFGGNDFYSITSAMEVNVLGALKLAHACHGAGVKQIVQISSIYAELSEKSPFYSSYSVSKRHSEELIGLYCRSADLALAVLRPTQIYGEGEDFRSHQPFLYKILDSAESSQDIVLYGHNDALRNFIHVTDLVEVIVRVVKCRIQGVYQCGALSNVKFSEMASTAVMAFSSDSTIRFDVTKENIPDNAFAIEDKLYRQIDYFPKISLAEGFIREANRRKGSS